MDRLFDKHFSLLQKSLDFRSLRQNMLSANVANSETPGYKARDLVFEEALGKAMRAGEPGPLQVRSPRHFDGNDAEPLALVTPETIRSGNPVGSIDGNTVDLEREMAKLGENQIMFQVLTQALNTRFRELRKVIKEGGP